MQSSVIRGIFDGSIQWNTFISIEPLLEPLDVGIGSFGSVDWVIVGAETGNRQGKVTWRQIRQTDQGNATKFRRTDYEMGEKRADDAGDSEDILLDETALSDRAIYDRIMIESVFFSERRRIDIILLHIIAALDFVNGDFFESIFEEHSDRAYKMAYGYVRHTEDAKEIVQDTFFKIYLHLNNFRGLEREEIIAMIVIYTKNTSLDFLRKKVHRIKAGSLTYEDEEEIKEYEIPDDQDPPDEIVINKEIKERLGKYIGLLPDSQREVIILKYYHNRKDKEIAEILNIDESAVSSRVNRAKAKLREMIGGGADEQDFKNR